MKKSEIQVGQEYGWASYKGARERHVKVIEVGVPGTKQRVGYGYSGKSKQVLDGVVVELLDDVAINDSRFRKGAKPTVASREITRPWIEVATERDAKATREQQLREQGIAERAARLPVARRLVEILTPNDEPERCPVRSPRYSYVDEEVLAEEIRDGELFNLTDASNYPVVWTNYPGVYYYWLTGTSISLPAEQILALAGEES